ncbi:MaoC family dehydratase N-terminal domain-containing protein [Microbacterium sp.]|uniref:FAS1-like dehydratase domain-containing protein n=1 Tax=Microbacterium sp. TaxID=51671 RepID=UPI002736778A|nr:MaoC family dehydratase N-terminal domain-containing protein [Microbacterium sp.]MDP3950262.1 MaoC family dehydratase N-terminal domain-containing protein [Microbacterium sp.]
MDTVVTPEMQSAVGIRISRRVSYPITSSDVRRWAIATYWPAQPPARYLAEDEAELIAPEELNAFAWAVVESEAHPAAVNVERNDPDRTERQIGVAGPGLKYQLNGGASVTYGVPMKVGDVITSETRLAGYSEREGRLGHMLMSTTEDTWTNQDGEIVKRSQFTLIRY